MSDPTTPRAASGRSGRLHTDVFVAAAIIAICIAIWIGTLGFPDVPAALAQGMGPALFPQLVLGVIIVLSLWLAISARSRPDHENEPIHRMIYLTLAAGLLLIPVLIFFGLYGAILFAVVGIGRMWGERRWWLLFVVAAGMAATIYLVFVRGFGIGLPRSLLWLWYA